jgi:hypothetical protein
VQLRPDGQLGPAATCARPLLHIPGSSLKLSAWAAARARYFYLYRLLLYVFLSQPKGTGTRDYDSDTVVWFEMPW